MSFINKLFCFEIEPRKLLRGFFVSFKTYYKLILYKRLNITFVAIK